ncbi:MAG TPA: PAS domain-containing protein [Gaiellaceae bacterium]|jgi:PAS domain S-box-containing protein
MQPVQTAPDTTARALIDTVLVGEALEHGPVAVFVFDEEGRYLAVNGMACRLLGYERDELLARRLGDLSTQTAEEAVQAYLAAMEAGTEATTEVRRGDGSLLRLHFRAASARAAGMPVYVGVAWPAS